MNPVVTVRDVSFEFANGRTLFDHLNFTLGTKVSALVGPNGIGKTCLARILAGELEPTGGRVRSSGPVTYFAQRQEPGRVTVGDFLATAYAWSALGEQLLEGVDRDAPCAELSGGQWMRVRLACALGEGFLILDEPTNDLDREGREAVMRFLRGREGGVLLISHDRECLGLCEEVLELSSQGLAKHGGGWAGYEEAKRRERDGLARALELATRERDLAAVERTERLERQEKRNRRGAASSARGGTPKILLGARKRRAQASTGRIDAATFDRAGDAVREARAALGAMKIDPVMYADLAGREIPAGKLVAEARGFNVRFGERWVYREDLSFCWRGGVRIALKGPNGSGKSTLLRAILGSGLETRGDLRRGGLSTLYVDQRCAQLDDRKSVFDNVREVSRASESEIRNGLAKLLFAGDAVFRRVGELSGGERLRAALARGLLSEDKPELLVVDEPTNNLDLANVEFLERLVSGFRGAVVVISHDEAFLANCAVGEELYL